MKSKMKTKFTSLLLTAALVLSAMALLTTNPAEAVAAEKAYGDSLTLNNNIKLNKTSTFTKTGYLQEGDLYPKKKSVKIKYTIKCSRKESGSNYKVTYKVNYKFLSDPKVASGANCCDDYYWGLTQPNICSTVFDYQTGMSLDNKNDLGVSVKTSNVKVTYYPKQTIRVVDEKSWYRNLKTFSYSFTVTYPKDCKDVVVGIGFANYIPVPDEWTDDVDNQYWDGKVPYGKTTYYKKGKKTMSYMRLK